MSEDVTGEPGGFLAQLGAGVAVGSRVAGYRLEELIGRGGMAVVFRARDERLSRQVALKILAPELASDAGFQQRFIGESRKAAAVDDPHIIPVYEAGEASGVLFIAMRYVPGGDVRTLLRREGQLTAARTAAIISPVASALDTAHAAGLVHRDVKLANMLVDVSPGRPNHVYLSDFGLSKEAVATVGLTRTGQFLGTLAYSAPEQIEGKPVDGRTDQYALACAAFELLTGAPPFDREHATALMWAHMSEPPPPVTSRRPDLPSMADYVLAKALAKAPADRYGSCREFADALRLAVGLVPYDSGPGVIVAPDQLPTEVPRRGPAVATPPVGPTPVVADLPTRPVGDFGRGDRGQDLPADRFRTPPQPAVRQVVAPISPWPVRTQAAVAGAATVLLAGVVGVSANTFPAPIRSVNYLYFILYLAGIVAAAMVLRKRQLVVIAVLQGLWWTSVAWLASDVVAVSVDHAYGLAGSQLASYYVGDFGDLLGAAGVILLWVSWRGGAARRQGSGLGQPSRLHGLPAILISGAGLSQLALLGLFATYTTDRTAWFTEGLVAIAVGLAIAWYAMGLRSQVLGGALLLGWAATSTCVLVGNLTVWSNITGAGRTAGVLGVAILASVVILGIVYLRQPGDLDPGYRQ